MSVNSQKIQIIVAVIGLVGVVVSGSLSNWEKLFPNDNRVPIPAPPASTKEHAINSTSTTNSRQNDSRRTEVTSPTISEKSYTKQPLAELPYSQHSYLEETKEQTLRLSFSPWMSSSEYQREFNRRERNGFYPSKVEGKIQNGRMRFRAIFIPVPSEDFYFYSYHLNPAMVFQACKKQTYIS